MDHDARESPLHDAILARSSTVVLDDGSRIPIPLAIHKHPEWIVRRREDSTLPIHAAVRTNQLDVVKWLLHGRTEEFTFDMDEITTGSVRMTPLILACAIKSVKIVRYLARAGANLNFVSTMEDQPVTVLQLGAGTAEKCSIVISRIL